MVRVRSLQRLVPLYFLTRTSNAFECFEERQSSEWFGLPVLIPVRQRHARTLFRSATQGLSQPKKDPKPHQSLDQEEEESGPTYFAQPRSAFACHCVHSRCSFSTVATKLRHVSNSGMPGLRAPKSWMICSPSSS